MHTHTHENGAFTINSFCVWAQLVRTKVYEEINAGKLYAVKVGGKTLIPRASAAEWLASLPPVAPKTCKSEAA
jgi:excisionase family DNA binding protein